MKSIESLKKETAIFLELHWPKNSPLPTWSDPWSFEGSVPNNDLPGCYAWIKDGQVLYIGVALGINDALGSRISNYWVLDKDYIASTSGNRKYKGNENLLKKGIQSIETIGFKDYSYLAAALEVYLIQKITPEYNDKLKK